MKNSGPVRSRAICVCKTTEQRAELKQVRAARTADFNKAVQDARTVIGDLINKISLEFSYNVEYVAEKLHLGGYALKQRRAAAINNAYAHCLAMCEKDCKFYFL
jgi:hypothetical protein